VNITIYILHEPLLYSSSTHLYNSKDSRAIRRKAENKKDINIICNQIFI